MNVNGPLASPSGAKRPPSALPTFVRESEGAPDTRHPVRPDQAVGIAPADRGVPPRGARTDAPRYFGVASLVGIRPNPDHVLLTYGQRWLAVVRGQKTERVFDLAAYMTPPFVRKKSEYVFPGPPTYVDEALLRGDVLYLCDGGGSYAGMAGGMKSYVTAVAYPTGELLWRSQPLVCNAPLVPWRGYLITGYGCTAEPDFLYAIRTSDGSVAGKVPIASAPVELTLDGDRLDVIAYDTRYVFTLSE